MRSAWGLGAVAAIALFGVANAQIDAPVAPPAETVAPAPAPPTVQGALIAYAAFQGDVSELSTKQITSVADIDYALERVSPPQPAEFRARLGRLWRADCVPNRRPSSTVSGSVRDSSAAIPWSMSSPPTAPMRAGWRAGEEATQLVAEFGEGRFRARRERRRPLSGICLCAATPVLGECGGARPARALATHAGRGPSRALMRRPSQSTQPRQLAVTPLSINISADSAAFGGARFWGCRERARLMSSMSLRRSPCRGAINDTRAEALDRMTSIAALQALGVAETQTAAVGAYLDDQRSQDCMEMAQLQLYQCMSAARFVYEKTRSASPNTACAKSAPHRRAGGNLTSPR